MSVKSVFGSVGSSRMKRDSLFLKFGVNKRTKLCQTHNIKTGVKKRPFFNKVLITRMEICMLNENCYGFAVKITCWWQIYHDFDRKLIFFMVGKQVKRFGGNW